MADRQNRELTGQVFGRWTVLDRWERTAKGERKWLCRCECGTERLVLERSLLSGGSRSCGCLRQERLRQAITYDLVGQTFGELTVVRRAARESAHGGVRWVCRCSCGREVEFMATLLVNGRRTHCGCRTDRGRPNDISGQRFGRLTALRATKARSGKGSVIWQCRCDCGNEVAYSYNELVYGNLQSCGCRKKEHDRALGGFLTHVAGTSVDMLKSKKIPRNNTTGVRGVYFIRGKYVAKIVLQRKAYYLGTYDNIEDAAEARRQAERYLNDEVVAFYEAWKECADRDPAWAEENPIRISVRRDGDGFALDMLPDLLGLAKRV